MPNTRWWTWTPPSLTTLPGHQERRGLRMIRVLMRMKAKEPRNPTSTRNSAWRSWATSWSCQNSETNEAAMLMSSQAAASLTPICASEAEPHLRLGGGAALGGDERFGRDLVHGPAARQAHREVEVRDEVLHDLAHPLGSGDPEPIDVRPAEQDRGGAQRQRLERVRAAADAAVEQHRHATVHRLEDARECVEGGDGAIDLATAVVGDDDPVHPSVHRATGVVGVKQPLEQDREPRALAQEGQVLPGQRRARVGVDEALDGGASAPGAQGGPEVV